MNIGAASNASDVSQRMIRHYEKIGLVPATARRGAIAIIATLMSTGSDL
jgi:DNA-binding transcriptional MerR regulator